MTVVASVAPTTAGIPYSRATTAAWLRIPPVSVTRAEMDPKSGVQAGVVVARDEYVSGLHSGEVFGCDDESGDSFGDPWGGAGAAERAAAGPVELLQHRVSLTLRRRLAEVGLRAFDESNGEVVPASCDEIA
jgi:hypothetical protein